jgi:hypothetical protein
MSIDFLAHDERRVAERNRERLGSIEWRARDGANPIALGSDGEVLDVSG